MTNQLNQNERRTYVCKRARLCSYLMSRGYQPYKIAPDKADPRYEVFLFTASPDLYEAVMEYINSRSSNNT